MSSVTVNLNVEFHPKEFCIFLDIMIRWLEFNQTWICTFKFRVHSATMYRCNKLNPSCLYSVREAMLKEIWRPAWFSIQTSLLNRIIKCEMCSCLLRNIGNVEKVATYSTLLSGEIRNMPICRRVLECHTANRYNISITQLFFQFFVNNWFK